MLLNGFGSSAALHSLEATSIQCRKIPTSHTSVQAFTFAITVDARGFLGDIMHLKVGNIFLKEAIDNPGLYRLRYFQRDHGVFVLF